MNKKIQIKDIAFKQKLKSKQLETVYQILLRHNGHQKWWPGDSPFEVIVGAILTQNTAWTNVEKAIAQLKSKNLMSARRMAEMPTSGLARIIKPAGFFNIKAKRLKAFLAYFEDQYDFDISKMRSKPLDGLRRELLTVHGIGPETADSILLYALNKPSFVIDAYTKRVFSRHGLFDRTKGYEDWRGLFMAALPHEMPLFNDFHAQIVLIAKLYCRSGYAYCHDCPLSAPLNHSKTINK